MNINFTILFQNGFTRKTKSIFAISRVLNLIAILSLVFYGTNSNPSILKGEERSLKLQKVEKVDHSNDIEDEENKKMFEALVSRNHAPVIPFSGQSKNAKDFNAEQSRVLAVAKKLAEHAEELWPQIVAHLDDERYSISYTYFGEDKNLTVGDVCFWIVSDYLAQAYTWHIPNDFERATRYYLYPEVTTRGNIFLKTWCESRSRKELYELQIEMCEWAVEKAPQELDEYSSEHRRAIVAALKGQITDLRETKKPLKIEGFGERSFDTELYHPKEIGNDESNRG